MKLNLYISIVFISHYFFDTSSQTTIISGQVEDFVNKKLKLNIYHSGPVGIFLDPEKYRVKTDKNGNFHFELDNPNHNLTEYCGCQLKTDICIFIDSKSGKKHSGWKPISVGNKVSPIIEKSLHN